MSYQLLGISGGYAGQSVPIPPQGLVVGRDATVSQLLLAAEDVSRRHATLVASAQGLILTDQQSSNGTYLEQEGQWVPLQGARTLQPGDKVRFGLGQNVFTVQWAPDPAPVSPPPSKPFPVWAVLLIVGVLVLGGAGFSFRDRWFAPEAAQDIPSAQTAPQEDSATTESQTEPRKEPKGVCLVSELAIRSGHTITSPVIGSLSMGEEVRVLDEWSVSAAQARKEGYATREMVAEDVFGNEYVLDEGQILMVEERKGSGAMIRFLDPDGDEVLGFVEPAGAIGYFNESWLKIHSSDGIDGWVYGEFILQK